MIKRFVGDSGRFFQKFFHGFCRLPRPLSFIAAREYFLDLPSPFLANSSGKRSARQSSFTFCADNAMFDSI